MMKVFGFILKNALYRPVKALVKMAVAVVVLYGVATLLSGNAERLATVEGWLTSATDGACFVEDALVDRGVVNGIGVDCWSVDEVEAQISREPKGVQVGTDDSDLPKIWAYEFVRVVDGDTVVVRMVRGDEISVRLRNIDAPEMSQAPAGDRSRQVLEYLMAGCGADKRQECSAVQLRQFGKDKHGRPIVDLWGGYAEGDALSFGHSLNHLMVLNGWAHAWRHGGGYGHGMLIAAENAAVARNAGVHNPDVYPGYVRPEDFKVTAGR